MTNTTTRRAVIVSYIKHWDDDTQGTIEIKASDLFFAILKAQSILIADALEDSVDPDSDPAALYTITKAELVANGSAWTGVPAARF